MFEKIIARLKNVLVGTAFYKVLNVDFNDTKLIDVVTKDYTTDENGNPYFNEIEWIKFIDLLEKNCIEMIEGYNTIYIFNTFQVRIKDKSMNA